MLSIIIVNYKTWHFIERNLDNLLASLPHPGDISGIPLEVIVADNSPDETGMAEFRSKFPWVKLIKTDGNFGYAHGCNKGASLAAGEWLLFMNPDVVCDWDNLQAFLKGAEENPQWQILTAPQFGLKPRRLQRTFAPFTSLATYYPTMRMLLRLIAPSRYQEPRRNPAKVKEILEVDWVSGSLLLIARENFDRLNGWDEDYWLYREDEDICRRANQLGMKAGYFPGATFIHSHASSTRLNPETRILTKSETALSTYLYLLKHDASTSGAIMRFLMRLQTWISYPLLELTRLLTLGSIDRLEQKRLIHQRLWSYYRRVKRTGLAVSDMSITFRKN